MSDTQWDRWARLSGIPFAVLVVVGFMLFGDAPKVDASGSEVAAFYTDHSGRILTGVPIIALGFLFLLWFAGAIANTLRESGQGRLGATVVALAGAVVAVAFVVQAMSASLALNIAENGDEGVNQAVSTLSWSIDALNSLLVGGFIAAATIGLRRAGIVSPWFGWLGLVAALLVGLRATAWASDGFWSPSGGYMFVLLIAGFGWAIVGSILLFRGAAAVERAPGTVSARPA
jgi:hypothetical protein